MKKIYMAFLIVVGSFLQSGNTQTVSSGGGKSVGGSNELLSRLYKSNEPASAALAAWNERVDHENVFSMTNPESNALKSGETVSQVDSATMQTAETAVMQMEEQAKVSLQDSVGAFMETNASQDHDIITAISSSKRGTDGVYLVHPTPDDILDAIAPNLVIDKESFARDVIKALLPYDVNLDAARRQATE